MFAVDQARAAEEFGFTRNQCCRNLKVAIKYYWQNRTMGMRNLAKRRLLRSAAAEGLELSACTTEHAVPLQVIVDLLLDDPDLTKKSLEETLSRLVTVRVVTKEEDRRLSESGVTLPVAFQPATPRSLSHRISSCNLSTIRTIAQVSIRQ